MQKLSNVKKTSPETKTKSNLKQKFIEFYDIAAKKSRCISTSKTNKESKPIKLGKETPSRKKEWNKNGPHQQVSLPQHNFPLALKEHKYILQTTPVITKVKHAPTSKTYYQKLAKYVKKRHWKVKDGLRLNAYRMTNQKPC